MSTELDKFLTPELKSLLADGQKVMNDPQLDGLADYSFLVFPFAKAYEGFLKWLFFRAGIISESELKSNHWRVGKALNPFLEKRLRRRHSSYDRLVSYCEHGKETADMMWEAWKNGRNQLFHYFPEHYKPLSRDRAEEIIGQILSTMEFALANCPIKN